MHIYEIIVIQYILFTFFHFMLFAVDDECHIGIHNCSQMCHNTPVGYQCSCLPGFVLTRDDDCIGWCILHVCIVMGSSIAHIILVVCV